MPNAIGAGIGASASTNGTQVGGLITVNTGTVTGFGDIADITVNYIPTNMYVILQPADATTATLGAITYVTTTGNTGFSINSISVLASATTYNWYFIIVGQ